MIHEWRVRRNAAVSRRRFSIQFQTCPSARALAGRPAILPSVSRSGKCPSAAFWRSRSVPRGVATPALSEVCAPRRRAPHTDNLASWAGCQTWAARIPGGRGTAIGVRRDV